jgi:hypothetical protein
MKRIALIATGAAIAGAALPLAVPAGAAVAASAAPAVRSAAHGPALPKIIIRMNGKKSASAARCRPAASR